MKNILLCFFALGFWNTVDAVNDFYIELLKGSKEIEIGFYKEKNARPAKIKTLRIDSISRNDLQSILQVDVTKKKLIYIHAMWGNGKNSQRKNLKVLRNICGSDYQIFSIVWKAGGLGYKKNWRNAIEKGEKLSPVLDYLFSNEDGSNNILCHSMGHRIFEGYIRASTQHSKFNKIAFMAADLDANVFEGNLKSLIERSKEINVYINQKDRALRFSKKRHKRNRLGLDGIKDNASQTQKNMSIDVTNTKAKGSKGISQHLYFKKDQKVIADLRKVFSGKEETRDFKIVEKTKMIFKL